MGPGLRACEEIASEPRGDRCKLALSRGPSAHGLRSVEEAGIHPAIAPGPSSNCNGLPSNAGFVPRGNGPRLPPGKRVDEQQFEFIHTLHCRDGEWKICRLRN